VLYVRRAQSTRGAVGLGGKQGAVKKKKKGGAGRLFSRGRQ
jgi:hypothetical protein